MTLGQWPPSPTVVAHLHSVSQRHGGLTQRLSRLCDAQQSRVTCALALVGALTAAQPHTVLRAGDGADERCASVHELGKQQLLGLSSLLLLLRSESS